MFLLSVKSENINFDKIKYGICPYNNTNINFNMICFDLKEKDITILDDYNVSFTDDILLKFIKLKNKPICGFYYNDKWYWNVNGFTNYGLEYTFDKLILNDGIRNYHLILKIKKKYSLLSYLNLFGSIIMGYSIFLIILNMIYNFIKLIFTQLLFQKNKNYYEINFLGWIYTLFMIYTFYSITGQLDIII